MSMHHQVVKSRTALLCVRLFISALLLLVSAHSAKARYLPTRADETDVEVLKDLIRAVLTQANLAEIEARINRLKPTSNLNHGYYLQTNNQQPFQVERRSVEFPIGGHGDSLLRSSMGPSPFGSLSSVKIKSDR